MICQSCPSGTLAPGPPRDKIEQVEPENLTVKILGEIREDLRGMRADLRESRQDLADFRAVTADRFEVVETTLRDLAEQMVMLSRAVKVAIEARDSTRVAALEQRVSALEARTG